MQFLAKILDYHFFSYDYYIKFAVVFYAIEDNPFDHSRQDRSKS
jgi:hypothetical protein